jgi:hypothetical protein
MEESRDLIFQWEIDKTERVIPLLGALSAWCSLKERSFEIFLDKFSLLRYQVP